MPRGLADGQAARLNHGGPVADRWRPMAVAMISGIVLAAGEATRMGRQKLLLDFKGRPVLEWVLQAALTSDLGEVICVVRAGESLSRRVSLDDARLRWVVNDKAREGQSASLGAGLRAVSPRSRAALFLVGDQPLIRPELIAGLIALFRQTGAPIVAPVFHGQPRNPVLFHRDLFPEMLELRGDRGGRVLIERHRKDAAFLDWGDETPFLDLDDWEDYERLKVL